ncbi:hypothetical protein ACFXPV_18560 [Streptomyces sp. NPDC059118]|uniref:hypothetical protein n=1 Tax=unclassified Streptomyces TaxID=2593676 RepID=UPI003687E7D7
MTRAARTTPPLLADTRATDQDRTACPGTATARAVAAPGRTAPPGTDSERAVAAAGPDRTAPPGTDTASAVAAHPVPKTFRSKERPS